MSLADVQLKHPQPEQREDMAIEAEEHTNCSI